MTKSRGIMGPRKPWTDEQIAELRRRYADEPTAAIAKSLGRPLEATYRMASKIGLHKSQEYMASPFACRLRRGDNVGADHRFKPGQAVWNKGMKGLNIGGIETQFKKGSLPHNHVPVGTIVKVDGYLKIKIAEPKQWAFVHRKTWEEANGPIPPGCMVSFKDGNSENCAIGNLELLTRAEHMKRHTRHNYPKEINELIVLQSQITRQINKREKNEQ